YAVRNAGKDQCIVPCGQLRDWGGHGAAWMRLLVSGGHDDRRLNRRCRCRMACHSLDPGSSAEEVRDTVNAPLWGAVDLQQQRRVLGMECGEAAPWSLLWSGRARFVWAGISAGHIAGAAVERCDYRRGLSRSFAGSARCRAPCQLISSGLLLTRIFDHSN